MKKSIQGRCPPPTSLASRARIATSPTKCLSFLPPKQAKIEISQKLTVLDDFESVPKGQSGQRGQRGPASKTSPSKSFASTHDWTTSYPESLSRATMSWHRHGVMLV